MSSKPGFWRKCRIAFRCARFTVWAAVLLVIGAFAWFNLVGLPGFLKTRLVAAMQQRGVDLEFSRMRLRFIHGLICDNVRVGAAQPAGGPVLTAREVQVRVNYAALLRLRFQVDGLVLHQGRFTLPLSPTNALALTNLQTELRFAADDTWALDQFRADLAGATVSLAGVIAHAPEFRRWKMFTGPKTGNYGSVQSSLKNFSDTLEKIHFQGRPQLNARLNGDARDVHSFTLNVNARAPGVRTPWFSAHDLQFAARLSAPADAPMNFNRTVGFWTNLMPFRVVWIARGTDLKSAELEAGAVACEGVWSAPHLTVTKLSVQSDGSRSGNGVRTPWFTARDLEVSATLTARTNAPASGGPAWSFWTNLQPFQIAWTARGTGLKSAKLDAGTLACEGVWSAPQLTVSNLSVQSDVSRPGGGVWTPWFTARDLEVSATLTARTNAPASGGPAWSFWTNLQPFQIAWTARGTDLKSAKLEAGALACDGVWSAPQLAVTKLSARLGGGGLESAATLDVATREVTFTVNSGFDPHAVSALLAEKPREWLAKVAWQQPPQVRVGGSLTWPAWTQTAGRWRDDIEPGLRLHGELAFTNALVNGVAPVGFARGHFSCSNLVWRLSDLKLAQGRTTLEFSGEESEATKNFRGALAGQVAGETVRPFLTTSNAVRGYRHLTFREPVALALNFSGNLRDFAALSATGRVTATDFAVRGQPVDRVTATLAYTNLTVEFFHPQLVRAGGTEQFAADRLTLDLAGQKLFLHGGRGRVAPAAVAEAIGPETAAAMEPYHFLALPHATVDGCIPLKHDANGELINDDADLWFEVVGDVPFRWRKFETPRITGRIHWLGHYLILTNAVAECYGGGARGWGRFDVETPGEGTDFSFFMEGSNVDFNAMSRALWSPTNQLRGTLSGAVTVTRANSSDWRTWNGFGRAELRDGLLWDAPIFGLMSPVLNTLTPGLDLGSSRATDATGRFVMTNGVIFTDSLEIRSLTMRLQYVGTVDLRENVTARATAQLLRNTPLIGSVVSLVLLPVSKVFECEVTGTLEQPKITPLYIPFPKLLTAPLHPIRSFEQLFSGPSTNPPAAKP